MLSLLPSIELRVDRALASLADSSRRSHEISDKSFDGYRREYWAISLLLNGLGESNSLTGGFQIEKNISVAISDSSDNIVTFSTSRRYLPNLSQLSQRCTIVIYTNAGLSETCQWYHFFVFSFPFFKGRGVFFLGFRFHRAFSAIFCIGKGRFPPIFSGRFDSFWGRFWERGFISFSRRGIPSYILRRELPSLGYFRMWISYFFSVSEFASFHYFPRSLNSG